MGSLALARIPLSCLCWLRSTPVITTSDKVLCNQFFSRPPTALILLVDQSHQYHHSRLEMDMTLLRWPCQLEQVDTLSTIEDWYEIDLECNIALRPTLSDLCF